MSTTVSAEMLKEALQKTGQDWLLHFWEDDADRNLEKTAAELTRFAREYRRRFKDDPDLFGLVDLIPSKAAAFFHPDTLMASQTMKIMIWRILMGGEIQGVDFHYQMDKTASLEVRLRSVDGQAEVYTTDSPSDFRVLRHFGILGEGRKSTLQGYYALSRSR